jgi:hypothetical protein
VFILNKKRDKYNVPCETDMERIIETDLMNVVSGNECTGLMPSPPLDLDEVEAYNDIYDTTLAESKINTPPPQKDKNK